MSSTGLPLTGLRNVSRDPIGRIAHELVAPPFERGPFARGDRMRIDGPDGAFSAYLARPGRDPAPVVVVLQEIFGVNADIRATCDELAGQGFLAIAPDLFWREAPMLDLNCYSEEDWKLGLALYEGFDLAAASATSRRPSLRRGPCPAVPAGSPRWAIASAA